jgi:hypothetical protein
VECQDLQGGQGGAYRAPASVRAQVGGDVAAPSAGGLASCPGMACRVRRLFADPARVERGSVVVATRLSFECWAEPSSSPAASTRRSRQHRVRVGKRQSARYTRRESAVMQKPITCDAPPCTISVPHGRPPIGRRNALLRSVSADCGVAGARRAISPVARAVCRRAR